MPEEQCRPLHRSVGDHHLLRLYVVELGDPLAEPEVAAPSAVAQRLLPVRFERPRGGLPHGLVGKDVGARGTAREADRPFGHWRVEYTNGAILHFSRGMKAADPEAILLRDAGVA